MSVRVVERIDDWSEQSFSGGYSGLHDLADQEFSGVVRAGGAQLFMTKGVAVGIQQGSIDDFEDASGTAYSAPTPALALLAIMQERSDEVRAEYYTENTPIAEVDQTLSDGGFTGFIELSENVLSGDYYLVYHRGRSMSVAFIGNAQRLLEGDDAFSQANDEVGIYEVRPVDIEAIEIPEPTPQDDAGDAADAAVSPSVETDEPSDSASDETVDVLDDPEPAASTPDEIDTDTAETPAGTDDAIETATDDSEQPAPTASESEAESIEGERASGEAEREPTETDRHATATTQNRQQAVTETPPEQQGETESEPQSQSASNPTAPETATKERATPESPSDLETKAIPSLDPTLTETKTNGSDTNRGDAPGREAASTPTEPDQHAEPVEQSDTEPVQASPTEPEQEQTRTETPTDDDERVRTLQSKLKDKQATIEELESELEAAEMARDEARAELATVQEKRDELSEEVERLQSELARLEEELGAKMDAERRITPREALDGTDIFVRYHSKGEGTLEKAHDAGHRREDVTENLRLEKHTQFDAATVSVGGQTYEQFLGERVEYNFVEWVVQDLLFEIQSTGHTETLRDLYDALPKINRIELNGVVTTTDESGSEQQETFDLVFRARMGEPLLVANINESRQGATKSMMESLITAAERVGQHNDEFVSAFLVTESFFEPQALETVAAATRGGLLSRDKRKSFVNLSRKRGYHLCLVEARNENFHLEVPEL